MTHHELSQVGGSSLRSTPPYGRFSERLKRSWAFRSLSHTERDQSRIKVNSKLNQTRISFIARRFPRGFHAEMFFLKNREMSTCPAAKVGSFPSPWPPAEKTSSQKSDS
jgi:hypothetical protein